MNRQSDQREGTILARLRQLGKERIVLPLSGGLSASWLSLQVTLCSEGIWNNESGVAFLRDDAATLVDYVDW